MEENTPRITFVQEGDVMNDGINVCDSKTRLGWAFVYRLTRYKKHAIIFSVSKVDPRHSIYQEYDFTQPE